MKSIDEIREISKIFESKKNEELKKFREKQDRREKKRANKLINKINRWILKSAKRGVYHLYYECKGSYTYESQRSIEQYFRKQGYRIVVDSHKMYRTPEITTIRINWQKVLNEETTKKD